MMIKNKIHILLNYHPKKDSHFNVFSLNLPIINANFSMPQFRSNSFQISKYNVDRENLPTTLIDEPKSSNWPVVYIFTKGKEEIYIGETSNFVNRYKQHMQNEDRAKMDCLRVIFGDYFNKSAILDIEQYLIRLFHAEGIYKLQNKNGGQSIFHDYYQRQDYLNIIDEIWTKLKSLGVATKNKVEIEMKDIFRLSPFNSLTPEQYNISKDVLNDALDKLSRGKKGSSVIIGGPGTGKSVVLTNMVCTLVKHLQFTADASVGFGFDLDATDESVDQEDLKNENQLLAKIQAYQKIQISHGRRMKIGIVLQTDNMKSTYKAIIESLKQQSNKVEQKVLKQVDILGPHDVVNQYLENQEKIYDFLFIDEAHRMQHTKCNGHKNTVLLFIEKIKKIYKDELPNNLTGDALNEYIEANYTNLDLIRKCSLYQVYIYDSQQTVKPVDISEEEFSRVVVNDKPLIHYLRTQLRCKGGRAFTNYIDEIFSGKFTEKREVENFKFRICENATQLVDAIQKLEVRHKLCRTVAGICWAWKDGLLIKNDTPSGGTFKMPWNNIKASKKWVFSDNALNEIGCIDTIQGFDLNYVGVILGPDIDYDEVNQRIICDQSKSKQQAIGRKFVKDSEEFRKYVINIYKVLLTRGVEGCYIYACNPKLQSYLKQFIDPFDYPKDTL